MVKLLTAHRNHVCYECGLKICKGERHWGHFMYQMFPYYRTHCNCEGE